MAETLEFAVTRRLGHMEEEEHVTDVVGVTVTDKATGVTGQGVGSTEAEAREAAVADLQATVAERARRVEVAERRAAEDPMARLARLERFAREQGFDG